MEASRRRGICELWLTPVAVYGLIFIAFTFPILGRFSTHFFANDGDGLSNVWNLWWVDTALTRLSTSPWFTSHLHAPHGTTLLGHTLSPFNGLVASVLEPALGIVRAHNAIVIFAFVFGAWSAFRLALHVSGGWVGSLVAGFVFGFSNYHFAHAQGHLNLVSLEWIPIFLLAWLRLLEHPSLLRAIAAALALLLVQLCDHYYFLYCVLAGALMVPGEMLRRRDSAFWLRPATLGSLAAFMVASALTSGVLVASLLSSDRHDPLMGEHPARHFSMDLLALWIPGPHWRFRELTHPLWSGLRGSPVENSVHIGLAVTIATLFALRQRARNAYLGTWWLLLAFFAVMSLGPYLRIAGQALPVPMPYRLLEWLLPPLQMGGVPVRMVVMVTLTAGLLAGVGIEGLVRRGGRARVGALLLAACMAVEFLPRGIPTTDATRVSGWVHALAALPDRHAFMDMTPAVSEASGLWFQTLHGIPMFEGFIARVPASVLRKDQRLWQLRLGWDFEGLCRSYGFAYFLLRIGAAANPLPVEPVWQADGLALYDVRPVWTCRPLGS